jgi:hypothetical protein
MLVLVSLAVGCATGGDPPRDSGTVGVDVPRPIFDSGPRLDAGPRDAGIPRDSGVPRDSGLPRDGGRRDSGFPGVDSGGFPSLDAGGFFCSTTADCASMPGTCCLSLGGPGICVPGMVMFGICIPEM